MCQHVCLKFENKILNDLTPDYYGETFTDKNFIKKVWRATWIHIRGL